jgi:cyclopropane fatty-acyl-phospholipid synthase-like methyltransferase
MFDALYKLLGKHDETVTPASPSVAASTPAHTLEPAPVVDGLVMTRLEVLQSLWGEGFSAPGRPDFLAELAKPVSPDPQKSVLDLSAGLGGMARTLASRFKTYVTGLERDAELASEGMKISQKSGFGRNAPVSHYNPAAFDYGKRVDSVIARELFYTVQDKRALIRRIAAIMKPRAHLLITDYTCADEKSLDYGAVDGWVQAEPMGAHPVTATEMAALLEKEGFDVRINEDMTKTYMRECLIGLHNLVRFLEGKKLAKVTRSALATEVELWAHRLAALDTQARSSRFYAIKKN